MKKIEIIAQFYVFKIHFIFYKFLLLIIFFVKSCNIRLSEDSEIKLKLMKSIFSCVMIVEKRNIYRV
jgi:hypothetical protein